MVSGSLLGLRWAGPWERCMPLMAWFSVGLLWAGLLNPRVRWRLIDGCQVHLDGVSREYLAEIGSKEIDGVLGPCKRVRLNWVQKA